MMQYYLVMNQIDLKNYYKGKFTILPSTEFIRQSRKGPLYISTIKKFNHKL